MTVTIKPLAEAQRAIQARKWVFSANHAKLVGRVGTVVECDKKDRSILVKHDDHKQEWWTAEALLRRIKATCKSEHPLAEFSCDKREFTCDDCGVRAVAQLLPLCWVIDSHRHWDSEIIIFINSYSEPRHVHDASIYNILCVSALRP